ncbi:MAG: DUF3500 domain-containing protein, partial [Planctomycetes bacterium]|nr:DUF3500 domain-containing protein [Planctomycetota bacterium]
MNEPIRKRPPTTGHRGSIRLLALFGAVLFVGLALYAAREMPTAPATAAADDKPAGPTDSAVAAATAFLESLDAGQRDTALLAYDSAKKPKWSNLPVTFVPRNG